MCAQNPPGALARKLDIMVNALPHLAPTAFMDGFDHNYCYKYDYSDSLVPYFKLGKAYREHFEKNRHKE